MTLALAFADRRPCAEIGHISSDKNAARLVAV
jgi:hypothetical protein